MQTKRMVFYTGMRGMRGWKPKTIRFCLFVNNKNEWGTKRDDEFWLRKREGYEEEEEEEEEINALD